MFSAISLDWRGQPLVSYETVVDLIASTKSASGPRIKAVLDEREYETGVRILAGMFYGLLLCGLAHGVRVPRAELGCRSRRTRAQ